MEPMISTKLNNIHKGKEPTFVISNRKEVINLIKLTLGTDMRGDLVSNQHVCDDISLSDHPSTHIVISLGAGDRILRKTEQLSC